MRSHAGSGDGPSSSGRGKDDLLIVGPGVLGSLIGKLWSEHHTGAVVIGQTNTETNHDRCITHPQQGSKYELLPSVERHSMRT